MKRWLLSPLFLVALASCSDDDNSRVVVPMYRGEPNGDDAALRGELVIDGRCLYVESGDGSRMQIAFPERAARWDDDAQRIALARGEASVGQRVLFGGSARPLTGVPQPDWAIEPLDDCAGGFIWMSGDSVFLDTP